MFIASGSVHCHQDTSKSHILFATDWPFSPTAAAVLQVAELDARSCFTNEERYAVYRLNAETLFKTTL